jgi:flagellar hook-associated protein 3 FlgL
MAIGRIGNNQLTQNIIFNIQQQNSEQNKLFQEISSNKKLLKPSDDPIGTNQSMIIRDSINRESEFNQSINIGELWTNVTSIALESTTQVWQRVNELAISAADGTKSKTDLNGMGIELDQLLQQLTQISNTENNGLFIFGGSHTTTPPFQTEINTETGLISKVNFTGNSFLRKIKTNNLTQTPLNILGSNAGNPKEVGTFIDTNTGTNAFQTLIHLRDQLLENNIIGISGKNGILDKINQTTTNISISQVKIGGTQQLLQLDKNRILEQNTLLNGALSQIEDADVAQTILKLNNVQSVYEAALAAGGRILKTSLLNYI